MRHELTTNRYDFADGRVAALDVLAVAGAIAIGGMVRIYLPFSPVPVTLQTLPVLLAGFAVGRRCATAGVLLFLGLGLVGLPIFAASFGPTLGYLLAFAGVPSITTRLKNPALGMIAATALIYAMGTTWLCIWSGASFWQGAAMGILPFLPGDMLKALVAYKTLPFIRR